MRCCSIMKSCGEACAMEGERKGRGRDEEAREKYREGERKE